MDSKTISKGILSAIAIITGIVLIGLFLFDIKSIIAYIVFASVLTLIGKPIASFLHQKLKFNNTIATIVTMSLFIGILFSLFSLFVPLFVNQGKNLSFLNYSYLESNIRILIDQTFLVLRENGIEIGNLYSSQDILSGINLNYIPAFFNSLLNILASLSIGVFATLFIAFYLIKENNVLQRFLKGITPEKHDHHIANAVASIKTFLSRYFIGLFFQISILFIIYASTLSYFDIPNAFVIAFLCALLNLIPYIGPLIGVFLMITLSLIGIIDQDFKDVILPTGLKILSIYGIAQLFDNFISQPIIFSKSAKSHPLEIFIVILISGVLFGILGMMIAVPGYTTIKVIAKEFFPNNKIVQFFTKNL